MTRDAQRYAAPDAALSGLTKEGYRALLEAVLAGHLDAEAEAAGSDPEHLPYLRGEINGLCVALRLLGGYEGVAFDVGWARSVAPHSFDWRGFLGYPPAEVVTAGADVTRDGMSVEVMRWPASSKEMGLALRGVRIELHPRLVTGEEPRVSWGVNLVDAQGRKLEGYCPKEFERMLERVRALARGEAGPVAGPS